jgi:hypothetical protein
MLNVIVLGVAIYLFIVVLNVMMLGVIMLNVVMLSVVAGTAFTTIYFLCYLRIGPIGYTFLSLTGFSSLAYPSVEHLKGSGLTCKDLAEKDCHVQTIKLIGQCISY